MTLSEIRALFLDMSTDRKTRHLALMAHNLTICARAASLPEVDDHMARHKLLGLNELLHHITAQIMHVVREDQNRYPDDVLIDILIETADVGRCKRDFIQAFVWSNATQNRTE